MAIPTDERKSKAELIEELERLRAQLSSNLAAQQLAVVQEIEKTLTQTHDLDAIYTAVGNKLMEIFDAQVIGFYEADLVNQKMHFPWSNERGVKNRPEPVPLNSLYRHTIEQGVTLLINEGFDEFAASFEDYKIPYGLAPKSVVSVPVVTTKDRWLTISLQDMEKEHAFSREDVRLLEALAATMGTALENARLFDETNQLNAELAVINSVQEGLAAELDFQGIIDLVGDKLRKVLKTEDIGIRIYDQVNDRLHFYYEYEHGERIQIPSGKPGGLSKLILESMKPLYGPVSQLDQVHNIAAIPGTDESVALLAVPIMKGARPIGLIRVEDFHDENAYNESDVRLLETLAGSMSAALENARLFEETQSRNAELAVINSIQTALAAELDLQGIYDLVGDKIQEIFQAQAVVIGSFDHEKGQQQANYFYEKGQREYLPPVAITGLMKHIIETGETLVFNENAGDETNKYGAITLGEEPKSAIFVPLKVGSKVTGAISLQDVERDNAYQESDVRLLETLANSMSVAIENARLFEETNQRNAELAVINSVQQGLASKLDMQAIYELVGDKVSEITGSEIVVINTWDTETGMARFEYIREKGERFGLIEREMTPLNWHLVPQLEAGNTIIQNENVAELLESFGHSLPAGEMPKTVVSIPLKTSGKVNTSISLQDTQREHAFDESTIRLVETLARSMGIALENASLFDETQRLLKETEARNAELAVINSVQEGLAAELDFQGIIDLVGDTLREVLDTGDIGIRIYDPEVDLLHFPYELEHGERLTIPSNQPTGLSKKILETSKPYYGPISRLKEEFQLTAIPGTDESKAVLAVPIMTGDSPRGLIVVEDFTDEHAYTETDVRLMETLANSMSVALENARLFEELQNSNREISAALERQTATGDILQIMANSPGEIQPVLEAVAEHAARLVEADDVQIYQADEVKLVQMAHYGPLPALQDGESLPLDPGLATGRAVLERRTIQVDAGNLSEDDYPISVQLQKRLKHRSVVMTPLVREGNAVGAIVARRNEVREFSETQVELLRTFANQAAIAIENVRLFEETKRLLSESVQQAEELKTVNTVSTALSAELELEALIELIGTQVQKIFSADIAYVGLLDQATGMIEFPFSYGEETHPLQLGEGLTSRVILEGQPLLINQDEEWNQTQGRIGVKSKSYLGVPISVGKEVIGVISVQSTQWINMYGQKEVRLLSTIAANVGAAISNANLFQEVERQKVYFEALISSAPVAIVTIDLDGNVSGWSPAAEELYGYTAEEAIGHNIDDLVANDPSIREEAKNYTNLNLEKPGPNQIQLKTQRTHKDGRLIDVTVSAMPVYIEGERRGYIAIYNDISQLEKARRDAEEANQAKSAFLANMSHELRTPLNAIIGFTRIVKRKGEDVLPDKQIDNLDKVLVSAEHLLGLINTVLDISKIEAGRMDIHVSSFDLKPLIDLVMVTTQPLVRQDQVNLVSEVADGLPMVQNDLEKIKQIMINLLSNAAKFTHEGEIKVAVKETDGLIQIDIADTGIGISPGASERIFEEFQQADVSTTREYGGTGLGLSISRSLARLLGGDLKVSSELGQGSTFTLTFPANFAQPEEAEAHEEAVAAGTGEHLVLVIDDNEDAIYLIRENLESAGYRVAVARNGEEGLALARDLSPFAITLDIMMPKKDGWQVLHDLKQNPDTRAIPVIMISIVDKKALGYRLGAADYLVKPLNEDRVLDSLEKLKQHNGNKPLKRLLVVDDDPNIADMIRQLLEDSSYQVEAARDGQDAWEKIEANPPDAVLLDLMMPRLDGFGLIHKLKQNDALTNLPVIVLTAKLLSDGERNALSDSVGRVIQKQGLSGEALLAEIRNSIRTRI